MCIRDSSVSAQGIGTIEYLWSNGSSDTLITSLDTGSYSLVITEINGCSSNFDFPVIEPSSLSAEAFVLSDFNGNNISCFGENDGSVYTSYTGGVGNYSVEWIPGLQSTDTVYNLVAGIYTATVIDSNNCETQAIVELIQPDSLDLTLSPTNISCFGGDDGILDLTVSGGVPDYIYDWSTGEVDEDIDTLTAGDYTVFVTDLNGCLDSISTTLTEPIAPVSLEESHVDVGCFGESTGSIDVSVAGGTPPYTYLWSNSATTEDLSD